MSALEAPVNLGVPIKQAIAWIGAYAGSLGTSEGFMVQQLCHELAAEFNDTTEASVKIPAAHILCEIIEPLRRRGDLEAAEKVEQIVQCLKGGKPRLISASLGLTGPVGKIDAQYEKIRKNLVAAGG